MRQDTYEHGRTVYSAQTAPLTGYAAERFREFLDSAESGEQFEFDDGTGIYRLYSMDGQGYTEKRAVRRGNGGANDYFTFGFSFSA